MHIRRASSSLVDDLLSPRSLAAHRRCSSGSRPAAEFFLGDDDDGVSPQHSSPSPVNHHPFSPFGAQLQEISPHGGDGKELPLFLARGLGIDRIASGLLVAVSPGAGGVRRTMSKDEIDMQLKTMVDDEPSNAAVLRKYAQFLYQVKGDPRRAEEYYSRAVVADPSDGEALSQYAKIVWELHHDEERSKSYFEKAEQTSPHNCQVLGAYAAFLWEVGAEEISSPTQH